MLIPWIHTLRLLFDVYFLFFFIYLITALYEEEIYQIQRYEIFNWVKQMNLKRKVCELWLFFCVAGFAGKKLFLFLSVFPRFCSGIMTVVLF